MIVRGAGLYLGERPIAGIRWSLLVLALPLAGGCDGGAPVLPPPILWSPPTGEKPIVTTAREGLEVHWWVTDDTDGAVARYLATFADPLLPADPDLRARWTASGLRMVRMPRSGFASLQRSLPAIQAWHRQWFGWASLWTELFRGRRTAGVSAADKGSGSGGGDGIMMIEGERRSFPAGSLRILARAWPAPPGPNPPGPAPDLSPADSSPGPAPTIRFELACQVLPDERATATDFFRQPRVIPEEERGPIVAGLTLDTTLEPGFIYVVTCEAPTIDWRPALPSPASGPARTLDPADSASPSERPDSLDDLLLSAMAPPPATLDARSALPFEPLGPPVSQPLTLGQTMMSASIEETGSRDVRVVLVILPRASGRYRLLP